MTAKRQNPHNRLATAMSKINKSMAWFFTLSAAERRARLQLAREQRDHIERTFGGSERARKKKEALAAAPAIAEQISRKRARDEAVEEHTDKVRRLDRATRWADILEMDADDLKMQIEAFKLIDGRKGIVLCRDASSKGKRIKFLADLLVEKYGDAAKEGCTLEQLQSKAAERVRARAQHRTRHRFLS